MTGDIPSSLAIPNCGARGAADFISHRGESHDAPENTMAAFRLAWERNTDGIELDVHLSADGEVMVMHDSSAKRTSGVDVEISETASADLRKLDVGSWKNEAFRGEKIPFLTEVLPEIPNGKKIFIELKSDNPALLDRTAAICANSKLTDNQIVIISFCCAQIERAAEIVPQYKRYLLDSWNWNKETKVYDPDHIELIRRGLAHRANGLDLSGWHIWTQEAIDAWRNAGFLLGVWTVDELERAVYYYNIGVDAITSNRAGELRQIITGNNP